MSKTKTVKVMVASNPAVWGDSNGRRQALIATINAVRYEIPFDKEVEVPVEAYEVAKASGIRFAIPKEVSAEEVAKRKPAKTSKPASEEE